MTFLQYMMYIDNISYLIKLFGGEDPRSDREIREDASIKFRKMGLL